MKEEIRIITVNEDPEIKIKLAIKPSKEDKYSNRTIIIIPGWLSGIDNFLPLAEALQSYGNAIIYEPRGFGGSITPHKKGLFSREEYNKELAYVIKALDLEKNNFILLGSCSGGSQAFSYILDGEGLMPLALTVLHPQVYYGTPFWLPVLGWIPTFIMNFVQKMIIGIYKFYLKRKATEETRTVSWAAERLEMNDDWCL
ncbi:MAG: alpha/beta fold hydrolase, partial [Candidatus Heimdallarchaeota archaeon]|nr:alpha/beta fold hydrolase [Candidatus Heimdallarchaeota archaeon]